MLKIRSLGHSTFFLDDGTHRLLIDPFLEGNPRCPVTLGEVQSWQPSAVLISHAHGDHWGNALDFGRAGVPIIATAEMPKTAPIGPMYLPRSEAGTMSAMIACESTIVAKRFSAGSTVS